MAGVLLQPRALHLAPACYCRHNGHSQSFPISSGIVELGRKLWRLGLVEDREEAASNQELLDEVLQATLERNTLKGKLSAAAVNAIEQFSRLNGLTGARMKSNFESVAPISIQNEARSLLEFCCFRYLTRCSADFHPSLKDAAFRRLAFVAMLGWQSPFADATKSSDETSELGYVTEGAFLRIAPCIPGVADRITAHNLFRVLTEGTGRLSFKTWNKYLVELCSVLRGRELFRRDCASYLEREEWAVCFGANGGQPVQKWDQKIAWPGSVTLTDRALYFQPYGIIQRPEVSRLDITGTDANVKKKKVGPLGAAMFDSALSVSSSKDKSWLLEFVDFSGVKRRDIWYSYIHELLLVYRFIREYAPRPDDPSIGHVYGAKNGTKRAVAAALLSIARVQAVQIALGKKKQQPIERLLLFSQAEASPCGHLVLQALALDFWGGRPSIPSGLENKKHGDVTNLVGTDGSVYLRNWMTSASWRAPDSVAFWKQRPAAGSGIVLGRNHVVGGSSHLERAAAQCREQSTEIEMTQATLDGATIPGIPENMDLLKELLQPAEAAVHGLERLKRWEDPVSTVVFLICCYTCLYRNWLRYALPSCLLASAVCVLALRAVRASGAVSPDFGKVSIKQRPPSNTIQKLISLKEALVDAERILQGTNLTLLKVRSLWLSSKASNMFLLATLGCAVVLLVVPFRVTLALLLLNQFTAELEFRKPMVREFWGRLRSWWNSVPATPVCIEPYEGNSKPQGPQNPVFGDTSVSDILADTLKEWFGDVK